MSKTGHATAVTSEITTPLTVPNLASNESISINLTEEDIIGIISKSVTAALYTHKPSHKKEVQIPAKEDGNGF